MITDKELTNATTYKWIGDEDRCHIGWNIRVHS